MRGKVDRYTLIEATDSIAKALKLGNGGYCKQLDHDPVGVAMDLDKHYEALLKEEAKS